MRLLVDQGVGDFGVMEPDDDQIPRYAVLSHTWEADGEEFLFKDLTDKSKPGVTEASETLLPRALPKSGLSLLKTHASWHS